MRVDVFVIKLKVGARSGVVLLELIRLSAFDTLGRDVIGAALDIPKSTIQVRFNLLHVTDVKFVMNKALRLDDVCLRLQ